MFWQLQFAKKLLGSLNSQACYTYMTLYDGNVYSVFYISCVLFG